MFSSVALLFACDLKLIYSGSPEQLERLQSDIDKLNSWRTQNCLVFCSKKCSVIELATGKNTKRTTDVALLLGDQILERELSSKDVGLIVNESLNWKEHEEYCISEALKCF